MLRENQSYTCAGAFHILYPVFVLTLALQFLIIGDQIQYAIKNCHKL